MGIAQPPKAPAPHRLSAATKRVVAWLVGVVSYLGALAGLIAAWPYWWYAVPVTVAIAGVAAGVALLPFAHEQVLKAMPTTANVTAAPGPNANPSNSVQPSDAREQVALSVTGEIGREKRPNRAYFAAHRDDGKIWLQESTNPEPFGGPPTHTLADNAFGTWTFHNDGKEVAIDAVFEFAYQWQRFGKEAGPPGTAFVTMPRIEAKGYSILRIGNFTSDYVLHLSPTGKCSVEYPGNAVQRPCVVQGANPTLRENVLTLIPGGRKW